MIRPPPRSTLFPYHDALPIFRSGIAPDDWVHRRPVRSPVGVALRLPARRALREAAPADRKSTRLNSSHMSISYAVFCLKKKKNTEFNIGRTDFSYRSARARMT